MATRNIVPRADGEGEIGTSLKRWLKVHADAVDINGTDVETELAGKTDKATLTTKGDLYIRDATGVTRLPVGSDGEVLTADSSQSKGVTWGTPDDPVDFATPSEVTGVHTTGSITAGTTSMTVASATGIVAGMYVVGEGIVPGTTVATVSGTTVTLSANAGRTLSSAPVGFYVADKVLSPGLTAGMLCRAWVNFNGTDTVAIRAAMNVSSITDNGTGNYTVNFTTPMPNENYSISGIAGVASLGRGSAYVINDGEKLTYSCKVYGRTVDNVSELDLPNAEISVFA